MKKLISILIFVLLVCTPFLNAIMAGNESCVAFPQGCDPGGGGKSLTGATVGSLIAEGGTYFLKSSSDIDLFLSLVESSELSGPDYEALQAALNSTIENMEKAKAIYYQLKNLAAVTPYNQEIISKLIEFDYSEFNEERGLIPVIFERVEKLLCQGDVRGVYAEFHYNTGQILETLYTLKKDVDGGIFPNLSTVWRVNQMFSKENLFGQYVAEVFYNLK